MEIILKLRIIQKIIIVTFIAVLLSACGSTKVDTPDTAESVFNAALMQFKEEKWQEAKRLFEIIKLQYPATVYADDAQFYLAEINFKRGEYVLASFNYNMVRRVYNKSEYAKEALYKTALSYYMMSPTYDRDQENTLKSIQIFSEFMAMYPNDELTPKAEEKIVELRDKLGEKEFQSAEIYRKMEYRRAALQYYNSVIENYSDTKAAEQAYIAKMQLLKEIGKNNELKSTIEDFKKAYPTTRFKSELQDIEK